MRNAALLGAAGVIALACSGAAAAQTPADAALSVASLPFVLNSLFLLICGALVMFMAAGFAMLEAGSVRAKSVSAILVKNICLYAIAGVMFFLMGYNLLFEIAPGGVLGSISRWIPAQGGSVAEAGADYAESAFWFFQMVFVATAASVVSGALAERMRLWPFLLFVAALTGVIYPIVGGWTWGGGWLASLGFADFAGSTIVHSVGGWAALAGAILLGPRAGRFAAKGAGFTFPHTSAPQIAIGVFILWFGWFGFNGGSLLSFSSVEDALTVSKIFVNTNAAAAGGLLTALLVTRLVRGKPDLLMTLNGALAGLVAITAEPSAPSMGLSLMIGAGGSLVMLGAARLLAALRIDDRVSHLILFGGYPAGWRHLASPSEIREREAVMVLTEAGWGRADPSYRRLFSATFLPDATPEELDWFDEFQRRTTSPRNAVRFLQAFSEIDVRQRLSQVKAPTLVIHSRGDRCVPLGTGRELASTIPSAEFVGLDSNNHLLIGREPAAAAFIAAVRRFVSEA